MTVQSVDETFSGSARYSVQQGREYTRNFRVLTDSVLDGPNVAIKATGICRGDPYLSVNPLESDPHAYVTDLTANQEDGDGLGWIVTVNYGWYDPTQAGGGRHQNPLLMPIDVSWNFKDQEHTVQKDIFGAPILNSARDPYNPPVIINTPMQIMTVVRNEASYDSAFAYLYRNSINIDSFAGQSAYFAMCYGITPKNLWHQDVGWYYQVTYEFAFANPRDDAGTLGWKKEILDIGMRRLNSFTNVQVPITLKGIPITTPMLLNGGGQTLKPNNDPVYNTYQVYSELPFAEFDFDVAAITGNRTGFTTPVGPPTC